MPVYIVHLSARDALEAVRAARDRGAMAFAETCPQYLFLSLDDMGNGFEGAKFVCSPPLRAERPPGGALEGPRQGRPAGRLDRPLPVRLPRPEGARAGDFRKIPNGLPGVEDRRRPAARRRRRRRPDHARALGRDLLAPRRRGCSACPAQGRRGGGRRRRPGRLRPGAPPHDLGQDAPHGRRLLVLRGPRVVGAVRRRHVARLGHRARRSVHAAARAGASSSSAPPPTSPGWLGRGGAFSGVAIRRNASRARRTTRGPARSGGAPPS